MIVTSIVLPEPQPGVSVYNVSTPPVIQGLITPADIGRAVVFQHNVLEQYKRGKANEIALGHAALYTKRLTDAVSPSPPQVAYFEERLRQMQAHQESISREMRAVMEAVRSLNEKLRRLHDERGSD
ncbi:hypothetical protein AAF712_004618 [Marasmius tenuissimus]|uniref:BLOC-1-related complex subunit 5 n=1 Tax=Marasmius tenuissimus TaxID=585030 RepID=A0ABR3A3K8_9AGAR